MLLHKTGTNLCKNEFLKVREERAAHKIFALNLSLENMLAIIFKYKFSLPFGIYDSRR